ncbi:hypothetical protein AB9P05_16945 [Roseivirga sp. BDSF3-8]|uniref:hypothetical protein n=1 Tax=Roseivirga sp. BDSF3-8 TaxID=3241598 RepID=UPI0035318B82
MKRLIISCFLITFALTAYADAKDDIKSVFESYKEVVSSKQGDKILSIVDKNTKDYYSDLLTMALSADKQTLTQTALTDQMTVLFLRHSVPAEKLRSLTGPTLLQYAVDQGMVGSNLQQIGLGEVRVSGDMATAPLVVGGNEVPAMLKFVKEEGKWKVDVTSMMTLAEKGLEMTMQQSGKSKTEFISEFIKLATQRASIDDLWKPVGR